MSAPSEPDNTKRLLIMIAIFVGFLVFASAITHHRSGPQPGDQACLNNSYNC